MKLFTAFVFLCVVGTALAATTLDLNSQLQGSLVQGSQQYTFSYSHDTSSKYQFVYVLPDVSTDANRPVVTIDKTNMLDFQANFQCSASASSSESQVKCAYSFQGCVKTTAPELYTITVNPPGGAANANLNFTIGSVNVAAGLSASVKALTKQTTCCGFGGASWHYVKASGAEVINSVSITLTKGSLSTPPPLYLLLYRICQLTLMLMLWCGLIWCSHLDPQLGYCSSHSPPAPRRLHHPRHQLVRRPQPRQPAQAWQGHHHLRQGPLQVQRVRRVDHWHCCPTIPEISDFNLPGAQRIPLVTYRRTRRPTP